MLKIKKVIFFCFMLLGFSSFAQELKQSELSGDWRLLAEKNDVKMYVRFENCEIPGAPKPFDFIFFKLENTSNNSKQVDLQLGINYDQHCTGCNNDDLESFRRVSIPAGTTVFGDNTFTQETLNYLVKNYNGTDNYVFESITLNHFNIK